MRKSPPPTMLPPPGPCPRNMVPGKRNACGQGSFEYSGLVLPLRRCGDDARVSQSGATLTN